MRASLCASAPFVDYHPGLQTCRLALGRTAMLGRTALLLAHTTLARGLVALAAAPALSTRSSSVCMQAQASRLTVLVPVADDSEEIETSCITDTLTRAGAEVVVASVMPELQVRMSRGLKVDASVDTWSHRVPPWRRSRAGACGRVAARPCRAYGRLRTVRTRGAGQPAPCGHSCAFAYQPRAHHTCTRAVW